MRNALYEGDPGLHDKDGRRGAGWAAQQSHDVLPGASVDTEGIERDFDNTCLPTGVGRSHLISILLLFVVRSGSRKTAPGQRRRDAPECAVLDRFNAPLSLLK